MSVAWPDFFCKCSIAKSKDAPQTVSHFYEVIPLEIKGLKFMLNLFPFKKLGMCTVFDILENFEIKR